MLEGFYLPSTSLTHLTPIQSPQSHINSHSPQLSLNSNFTPLNSHLTQLSLNSTQLSLTTSTLTHLNSPQLTQTLLLRSPHHLWCNWPSNFQKEFRVVQILDKSFAIHISYHLGLYIFLLLFLIYYLGSYILFISVFFIWGSFWYFQSNITNFSVHTLWLCKLVRRQFVFLASILNHSLIYIFITALSRMFKFIVYCAQRPRSVLAMNN